MRLTSFPACDHAGAPGVPGVGGAARNVARPVTVSQQQRAAYTDLLLLLLLLLVGLVVPQRGAGIARHPRRERDDVNELR